MAIIETINDEYHFARWISNSDSYKNNFTFEGAKAVQAYYDDLSDDQGEPIEFDPIAWCCEFSEYENITEAWNELGDGEATPEEEEDCLEYFRDRTTVIELDNGGIILGEF